MREFDFNYSKILYFVLALGYFDTVTRFSFYSGLSPFRLLISIALMIIAIEKGKALFRYHLFMILIAVYSISMVLIWNGNFQIFVSHYVHWMFVYAIFISIIYLSEQHNFEKSFFKFVDILTLLIVSVFYFEYFTGICFFADKIAEHDIPSVFYYGINDFASAVMAMGVLYACRFVYERKIFDIIKFFLIFIAVSIVGAKASMLCLFGAVAFAILLKFSERVEYLFHKRIILILLTGIILLVVIIAIDPQVGDAKFSELLLTPLSRILKLEVSSFEGSITLRTTAMVLGFRSLINTFGFGLGVGNATYMLTNYGFYALKSMHNIIMQLLTELGWVFVYLFISLIKCVLGAYKKNKNCMSVYALVFVLLTPLFAIQSSEGLMSIYPFWTVYFFVIVASIKKNEKRE